MSRARYVVSLLSFAAVGLAVTSLSLVSQGWWQAKYDYGTLWFGPLKTCYGSDDCFWNSFSDAAYPACFRSGVELSARVGSALALALLAGLCGVVGGVVGLFAKKTAVLAAGAITFFGGFAGQTSMILFEQTFERWLFCNDSFCNAFGFGYCRTAFSASFVLMGVATILLFVAGLIGAGLGFYMPVAPPTDAEVSPPVGPLPHREQGNQPVSSATTPRFRTPPRAPPPRGRVARPAFVQETGVAMRLAPAAAAVGPADVDGDWTWDEEAQMYWSDFSQLFIDRDSGWYYDPYARYWYDPESQNWVRASGEVSRNAEVAA